MQFDEQTDIWKFELVQICLQSSQWLLFLSDSQ